MYQLAFFNIEEDEWKVYQYLKTLEEDFEVDIYNQLLLLN